MEDFVEEFPSDMAIALGEDGEDSHVVNYGNRIKRTGKVFSYTFWRTQIDGEVFWSVQGCDNKDDMAAVWIVTQYFGPREEARRFRQDLILHHPTEKKIKMAYSSGLKQGENCVKVSKTIAHHFRNRRDNTFAFEFRIVKTKRRPFPQRNL